MMVLRRDGRACRSMKDVVQRSVYSCTPDGVQSYRGRCTTVPRPAYDYKKALRICFVPFRI